MKIMLKTSFLSLWMGLLLIGPGLAQPVVGLPGEVEENIRARVDSGKNVGIIVGVVDAGGMRFYSYGSTTRSGEQDIDEHTVFEIGSITKVFTGILLADMAQRGEVALDDPIAKYLPDGVTVPQRGEEVITLAHLSTHSSGLPRLPSNFAPSNPRNPYADYTVAQLYDFLSNYRLRRDIGAKFEYSNYGVGLLGHVLALRGGMSYEALLDERITSVLGLDDTRITLRPDMQQRLATGHSGRFKATNWDLPTLAGAGALRSTAHDLLRFVAANMGLEETPLYEVMQATHQPRRSAGREGRDIGLGWIIRTSGDIQTVWHNGGTGGYKSFAGFNKDGQLGVVVLSNSNRDVDDIGIHLLDSTFPLRDD